MGLYSDVGTTAMDAETPVSSDNENYMYRDSAVVVNKEDTLPNKDVSQTASRKEVLAEYRRLLQARQTNQRKIEEAEGELLQQDKLLEEYYSEYDEYSRAYIRVTGEHADMARKHEQFKHERDRLKTEHIAQDWGGMMLRWEAGDMMERIHEVTEDISEITRLLEIGADKMQAEIETYRAKQRELELQCVVIDADVSFLKAEFNERTLDLLDQGVMYVSMRAVKQVSMDTPVGRTSAPWMARKPVSSHVERPLDVPVLNLTMFDTGDTKETGNDALVLAKEPCINGFKDEYASSPNDTMPDIGALQKQREASLKLEDDCRMNANDRPDFVTHVKFTDIENKSSTLHIKVGNDNFGVGIASGQTRIPATKPRARGSSERDATRFRRIARDMYTERRDYKREELVPEHERHVMKSNSEYMLGEGLVGAERQSGEERIESAQSVTDDNEALTTSRELNENDRRHKVVKSKIDTGLKHKDRKQKAEKSAKSDNDESEVQVPISNERGNSNEIGRINVEAGIVMGTTGKEKPDGKLSKSDSKEVTAANRRCNSNDRRHKVVKPKIDTGLRNRRAARQENQIYMGLAVKETNNVSRDEYTKRGRPKKKTITAKIDTGLRKKATDAELSNSFICNKSVLSPERSLWNKYQTLPPIKMGETTIQCDNGKDDIHRTIQSSQDMMSPCSDTVSTPSSVYSGTQLIPTPPRDGIPKPRSSSRMSVHVLPPDIQSPLPPITTGPMSINVQQSSELSSGVKSKLTTIGQAKRMEKTLSPSPQLGAVPKSHTGCMRTFNLQSPLPPIQKVGPSATPSPERHYSPTSGLYNKADANTSPQNVPNPGACCVSMSPSPPPGGAPNSRPRGRRSSGHVKL